MRNGLGLSRSTVALMVVGLVTVSVAAWVIGLEWPQAILVGLAAVCLLGLRRVPVTSDAEEWPPRTDDPDDRGVRREVTRLSWTMQGYESRVEPASVRRLRSVTARRLAVRGLDLDFPGDAEACRAALGPVAYGVVTADSHARVHFDAFTGAVAAVERLADVEGDVERG